MNYGHRLNFGLRLPTDGSSSAALLCETAVFAEELGLELLVVPAGPVGTHLDSWTAASWVAAHTHGIGLTVEVDPAAHPALLARSAAGLDHLSGGRVGLTIVPSGEPDSTVDAIGVVRELWNVLDHGLARFQGRFHRLAGAQKTAPAHDIQIALVGLGHHPAAFEMVGRHADGWTTADATRLSQANLLIDRVAQDAGRDPREIRRNLTIQGRFGCRSGCFTGSATDWVGDLLPLVLDHGVGTIVLDTAERDVAATFASTVVPALRAAVHEALPDGWASARIRRSTARARRRPGIDYDDVPTVAEVVEPGDLTYAQVRSGYLRGGAPGIILRANTNEQVGQALAFARRHPHLPLSRRSAGHGVSGRSTNDGGIVIDVSLMNTIEILDTETRRVRIGPGARWSEVARALEPHGWALSSGDYGGVGVGGLATAGGIGYLARGHGLTIDRLRAVEMVLADGSVVRADDAVNADLFWAVRGAGANFGIVTAFEFEVDEVGAVGFAELTHDATALEHFLVEWGRVVENSPRDLTSFLIVAPPRGHRHPVAVSRTMIDSADRETILDRLSPLAAISAMYAQSVVITSYAAVMDNNPAQTPASRGEPVSRSGLLRHVNADFATAAARVIRSGAVGWFQLRSVGGAVADVPADQTAYAHRDASFSLVVMGADDTVVDRAWEPLRPFLDGLYLSFESSLDPGRIARAWPPPTLARLRALKTVYDPDGVFDDNFALTHTSSRERHR